MNNIKVEIYIHDREGALRGTIAVDAHGLSPDILNRNRWIEFTLVRQDERLNKTMMLNTDYIKSIAETDQ